MYFKLQPEHIGRYVFERFCKAEGLSVSRLKNWSRTTDSSGVIWFDNLMLNLELVKINQVWQSDITYFEVNGRFYYITFILDSFSRLIVGFSVSKRLLTNQTTLPALEMAVKYREKQNQILDGLIFHSDGGGQYYAKEFLEFTGKHNFENSICKTAWENGKAGRINGVIKNNYLTHRSINSFLGLKKKVDRSVQLYNNEKPHISLQRKTPIQFEKDYICNGQNTYDDKSTTEIKSHPKNCAKSSSVGWDKKTSESNITHEIKMTKKDSKNKLKTVNVI